MENSTYLIHYHRGRRNINGVQSGAKVTALPCNPFVSLPVTRLVTNVTGQARVGYTSVLVGANSFPVRLFIFLAWL